VWGCYTDAMSDRLARLQALLDGCWALGMSMYIPAEIRADYLERLDVTTLRARAGAPTDGSKPV
jgi:hypothetical protein